MNENENEHVLLVRIPLWVGIKVLWYALLKNKLLAEGAAQLYEKLVKAEKDGKTFKEALEEHKPEN